MPERTYGTIVTTKGVQQITNATLENTKVNITEIAVGDGGGSYYQPTPSMTALKAEKWRGSIASIAVNESSANMIDVVAVIPSSVGGWTIREMGLFDAAGNMIAICNAPDTEKVLIESGAAGEIQLNMHIEISNTDSITFVVDPNVIIATKKNIQEHNSSSSAHENLFNNKANVTDFNNHANNATIHVTPELTNNYNTAIAGLIQHAENENIHTNTTEKAKWNTGATKANTALQTAQQATNDINILKSQMAKVEDGLYSNITGNPFNVFFNDIEGVTVVKGIWNEQQQRVEC